MDIEVSAQDFIVKQRQKIIDLIEMNTFLEAKLEAALKLIEKLDNLVPKDTEQEPEKGEDEDWSTKE